MQAPHIKKKWSLQLTWSWKWFYAYQDNMPKSRVKKGMHLKVRGEITRMTSFTLWLAWGQDLHDYRVGESRYVGMGSASEHVARLRSHCSKTGPLNPPFSGPKSGGWGGQFWKKNCMKNDSPRWCIKKTKLSLSRLKTHALDHHFGPQR